MNSVEKDFKIFAEGVPSADSKWSPLSPLAVRLNIERKNFQKVQKKTKKSKSRSKYTMKPYLSGGILKIPGASGPSVYLDKASLLPSAC